MITIENYEIYYLDYLDGNLSEELSEALRLFLMQHPDLVIEETDVRLNPEEIDYANKAELKVWDENEVITLNNVELFTIAAEEKLLSTTKQIELSRFTQEHSALQNELSFYTLTKLQPNLNWVYADKNKLKRKNTIVLWPWLSAAAVVTLLFSITSLFDTNNASVRYTKSNEVDLFISSELEEEIQWKSNRVAEQKGSSFIEKQRVNDINRSAKAKVKQQKRKFPIAIEKLPVRQNTRKVSLPTVLVEPQEINQKLASQLPKIEPLNSMNNPIWAVTNLVGAVTNKDVDFRTAKETEENTGGFHIKFGTFEVYKNNSKKL